MYKKYDIKDKRGFSLPELIAVLIILVLIALIAINVIKGIMGETEEVIDSDTEKQIINAAEKWAIENSNKFDDVEGKKIQVGLDVVFIIDTSGGMAGDMPGDPENKKSISTISAVNSALDVLSENELNRVGYVFFSGEREVGVENGPRGGKNASIRYASSTLSKIGNQRLKMIDAKHVELPDGEEAEFIGATYTQLAIQNAVKLLNNSAEKGRIPAIILVTDGEPSVGLGKNETRLSDLLTLKNADSGEGSTTWCMDTEVWNNSGNYGFTYVKNCPKVGYSSSEATKRSAVLSWNIMQSAELSKKLLKEKYGSDTFFYTIGIGLTSHYAEFLLNPTTESYNNLLVGKNVKCTGKEIDKNCLPSNEKSELYWDSLWHMNISEELHEYIEKNHGGVYPKYPTKAFTAATMNVSELNDIFKQITTQITEATKVTEVCITLDDLYKQGYISKKDIKLKDGSSVSEYVIMSINEATNQYSFNLAKTSDQKAECEKYLINNSNN